MQQRVLRSLCLLGVLLVGLSIVPTAVAAADPTSLLSLDRLRLPTNPLPSSSSGLHELAPAGGQPADEDEPLDPHQQAAPSSPNGDDDPGPWSLLWALPLAAVGLVGVVVGLRSRPEGEGSDEGPPPGDEPQGPVGPKRPPAGVDGVLTLGHAAVQDGELEEAVQWFDTAIAARPMNAVAHNCLGLCLYGLERYEEAGEAFRNAGELAPEDPSVVFNLARCLARQGRMEETLEQLLPVLEAYPDLVRQVQADDAFQGIRDHPRFLALVGAL